MKKVLSILMVVVMLACVSTTVFATVDIDGLKNQGNLSNGTIAGMSKIGGTVINFITNAAMILAVVVIAVLGVKYMMGSTEEKAEYKKSMMPYLIGAILVFGATTIAKMVTSISF